MASDSSPTRNGMILALAAVAVVTLVGIKFALDSYFISITEATAHEKLVSPEQLITHREREMKALNGGSMSIESAMSEMTRRGRDGLNANGIDLLPRQSDDTGALTGWSKMPKALPAKPAPVEPTVVPAAPLAPASAGPTDPHGAPHTTTPHTPDRNPGNAQPH
jgi:hypothetical protein